MSATITGTWPQDEDGVALARITLFVRDLIGLPKFSNVTVAGSIEVFVGDNEDEIRDGLRRCAGLIEEIIGEEREKIIDALEGSGDEGK